MRVFYHLSSYMSHRISGLEYVACLDSLGIEVTREPREIPSCDAAILHDDPLTYHALFDRNPSLRDVRGIACCVWENERLPEAYLAPLSLVNEIWTPSHFSAHSMTQHFSNVSVLPHVVRRMPISADDMAFARSAIRAESDAFRFFSIVDAINPRKNIETLLGAFAFVRKRAKRPVQLVLKQYRCNFDLQAVDGVVNVEGDLSPGQMGALHVLSDAYVSAHHAEGWGLGLSEAMAYGKPVIATGYSGNMDFMDTDNSYPIPYRMTPVSARMRELLPLFSEGMLWADVDRQRLADTMKWVSEHRLPPELPGRAAAIVSRFGPKKIAGRLRELLMPGQPSTTRAGDTG